MFLHSLRFYACFWFILIVGIKGENKADKHQYVFNECKFHTNCRSNVSTITTDIWTFNLTENIDLLQVQVTISGKMSMHLADDFPLAIAIVTPFSSAAWTVPLLTNDYPHVFYTVKKWVVATRIDVTTKTDKRYYSGRLMVNSGSPEALNYTIRFAQRQTGAIELKLGSKSTFRISAIDPEVSFVNFTRNDDTDLQLVVQSDDKLCGIVAIQSVNEGVLLDSPSLTHSAEYRFTYTTGANVVLKREYGGDVGCIFIMFLEFSDDINCGQKKHRVPEKMKKVWASVVPVKAFSQFPLPISLTIVFFLAFYLVPLVYVLWKKFRNRNYDEEDLNDYPSEGVETGHVEVDLEDENNTTTQPETQPQPSLIQFSEATVVHEIEDPADSSIAPGRSESARDRVRSSVTSDVSCIREVLGHSGTGNRLNSVKSLGTSAYGYQHFLFVCGLFFLLSTIRLVVVLNKQGMDDGDLCHLNTKCAFALGPIPAFNHLMSNVGYVLLGFLFFLIVHFREKAELKNEVIGGIPKQFDMLRCLGGVMMAQGIISSFYHVCPSVSLIQTDMAFMYVMIGLCLLYLFGARHGATQPHVAFTMMAVFLIFSEFATVLEHGVMVWVMFIFLHFAIMPFLSLQIYYNGQLQFNMHAPYTAFRSLSFMYREELKHGHWKPLFTHRLVFLAVGIIVGFIITVVVRTKEFVDIPSYLLSFLLFELIGYLAYYIFNKLKFKERIGMETWIYLILSLLMWAGALACFFHHTIDWDKTAEESRELNRDCMLLGFYDVHDIWHLLSAMAIFFSFMGLSTLDDYVDGIPRHSIVLF